MRQRERWEWVRAAEESDLAPFEATIFTDSNRWGFLPVSDRSIHIGFDDEAVFIFGAFDGHFMVKTPEALTQVLNRLASRQERVSEMAGRWFCFFPG